ncbi:MAG: MarR family EPS-associated transcriptional regulator [Gammaproteobacteria bacterium]|nr:MarR family EPS-associated transcriptional regulator [Gammaproteobacteria bacterium]
MFPTETKLRIMRLIESQPEISQRELAKEVGVSLGKVNYCLKALVEKGLVKAGNFQRSPNKGAYIYCLTPTCVQERLSLTQEFLRHKVREYERIQVEIEQLRADLAPSPSGGGLGSGSDHG